MDLLGSASLMSSVGSASMGSAASSGLVGYTASSGLSAGSCSGPMDLMGIGNNSTKTLAKQTQVGTQAQARDRCRVF